MLIYDTEIIKNKTNLSHRKRKEHVNINLHTNLLKMTLYVSIHLRKVVL